MRVTASVLLGIASVAVFVGSVLWAWATFDFWETIPLVPCVLGAGVLAAFALYVPRRRPLRALGIGLAVTIMTFLATAFVTLSRWEG
jgi:peptidoglycan/LPS O-acetylase OafA/YrhL